MPIYLSMQGFLRIPDEKIDDKNYSIKLEKPDNLDDILNGITAIFLDESEAKLVFDDDNYSRYDIDEIVITKQVKVPEYLLIMKLKLKPLKLRI